MRKLIVLLAFVSTTVMGAGSSEGGPRLLLDRGLNTYKTSGAAAALKLLTKNGPLAGEKGIASVINNLRTVEEAYGRFEGYDVFRDQAVTPRLRMIYFVLYYEKNITYGRFTGYQLASGEWISTGFTFNTDPSELVPAAVMFKD